MGGGRIDKTRSHNRSFVTRAVLTPCPPLPLGTLGAASSGEGELTVGLERLAQRRFEVLSTGIFVAHSNDAIARTFQEPSPRLVVASLRFSIVHVPLELDHNPFTGTIEIHNKAVQNVLSRRNLSPRMPRLRSNVQA